MFQNWKNPETGSSVAETIPDTADMQSELPVRPDKLDSLEGQRLRVVGLADPDYPDQLQATILPNGRPEFKSGVCLDLLNLLEFSLKFNHEAVLGSGWPERLPNGSWKGISHQILSGEADLSITQSAFISERFEDFDFLLPTAAGHLSAAFRQEAVHSGSNLLTATFKLELWIALSVAACLIWSSVKLTHFVRSKYCCQMKPDTQERDAGYWILVTFCQRAFIISPESITLRVVYISLTVTTILTYTAFSATLITTLSIESVPIRGFEDLLKSKLEIIGDSSAPFTHQFVKTMARQRRQLLGLPDDEASIESLRYIDLDNGIRKIASSPAIYITFDKAPFIIYGKRGMPVSFTCQKMFHFKVPGSESKAGMFVRKGSSLRRLLNPTVVAFYQYGFMRRLHAKSESENIPRCTKKLIFHSTQPIDIADIKTAFVVLVVGILLCIFVLGLEFITSFVIKIKQ